MPNYSFAGLRKSEGKFHEEVKKCPFPPLDRSTENMLSIAFDSMHKKLSRNAEEMGMPLGEYLQLDSSLKDTFRQDRIEKVLEIHPGSHPDEQGAYINGKTEPEDDEIFYKHAKECRPCLRSLFLLDTLDPGLTGLLKPD